MAAIDWSGGSACAIALKNELDPAIVVAADTLVHRVLVEINEATGRAKKIIQNFKTDDNPVPVHKVAIIHDKFMCVTLGLRKGPDGVNNWVAHRKQNTGSSSTIQECVQVLENYRLARFANHGDKKNVEILLVGWNGNEPIMHYFQNNGNQPIAGGIFCFGKAGGAQLMALNKKITTLSLEAVVAAVQRTIYDAHISNPNGTGLGVDVLILRQNVKPDTKEIQYQTMEELKTKFGTDKTTFNEKLQKRKEEEEAIRRRAASSSSR